MFHLKHDIHMYFYSTESLFKGISWLRYLKNSTEHFANNLFSMYFHILSKPQLNLNPTNLTHPNLSWVLP